LCCNLNHNKFGQTCFASASKSLEIFAHCKNFSKKKVKNEKVDAHGAEVVVVVMMKVEQR